MFDEELKNFIRLSYVKTRNVNDFRLIVNELVYLFGIDYYKLEKILFESFFDIEVVSVLNKIELKLGRYDWELFHSELGKIDNIYDHIKPTTENLEIFSIWLDIQTLSNSQKEWEKLFEN